MGCSQSKIENEESLRRCKERKIRMKEAVSSRNAFAAAHSAYAIALKNTGAALSDYAHAEAPDHRSHPVAASTAPIPTPSVQPPIENLPPPPPPLPDFTSSPLQRSASMPDLAVPKPIKKTPAADASILEEDEDEDADDEDEEEDIEVLSAAAAAATGGGSSGGAPPPPPPAPSPSPPPMPMPEPKGMESTWAYFFGMEGEGLALWSGGCGVKESSS